MDDCVFCKIVKNELPSMRIFEDEATIALLTIQPSSPGHTLVIPKKHVVNIFEADQDTWARVQETVRKVAPAIEKALDADGLNLHMNNREHGGQVVPHIHIHIIPRFKGDGHNPWQHSSKAKPEENARIAQEIRSAMETE